MNVPDEITQSILQMFRQRGHSQYGGEAVSQLEHALQTAALAADRGADHPLIAAALLHDVGHLLHDLPEDAPDHGVDDRHEVSGGRWLAQHFSAHVVEPVRLHVPAKRYLCAVDAAYYRQLSEPSQQSLQLQGGAMDSAEVAAFEQNPHFENAVQLRRWDDLAKIPDAATPSLEHFGESLTRALQEGATGEANV